MLISAVIILQSRQGPGCLCQPRAVRHPCTLHSQGRKAVRTSGERAAEVVAPQWFPELVWSSSPGFGNF